MKRLVLVICLCGLLAVPAMAMAGVFATNNQFQGRVEGDPNTYFGFDVARAKHHRQKVRQLSFAVPMACYNGDQDIVEVRVPGSFRLGGLGVILRGTADSGSAARAKAGHRHHRAKIFLGEADVDTANGSGEAYFYGVVRRHGKAAGYLHVHTHGESLGKCYTGYLEWRAHRGLDVTYPPVE